MKVLFIIPNLSKGGAERLVLDICNELIKTPSFKVRLVLLSDQNEYRDLSARIDIQLVQASVKLSLFKPNQLLISDLQKAIEAFAPDIIHTHLFEAEIVTRSCFYPQAKWFSHCHDNMRQFENLSLNMLSSKEKTANFYEKQYLFYRYKINKGTKFIAISNDVFTYFKPRICNYSITLLHNAINFSKFYKPLNNTKPSKVLRLVNTGSFVDKKNQIFLVEVVAELKKRNIICHLDLLGDGNNKSKILAAVQEAGLTDSITLRGNVNNVEEYLWDADIYVHSATYEPLGLVLIEAMAAGLPVVSLDGRGNRDLIKEGANGFMIDNQNLDAFVNAIMELRTNDITYKKMAVYAQDFAKQYDIAMYCQNLVKLYQS